mgnify:CR=1 FL=1|tara:strand:+ start:7432 stop:7722 length:291 start_codon:yes stop_codon:yes gene_type:complete
MADEKVREAIISLEKKLVAVLSEELDFNCPIEEDKRTSVALTTLGVLLVKIGAATGVEKKELISVIDETWEVLGEGLAEEYAEANANDADPNQVIH